MNARLYATTPRRRGSRRPGTESLGRSATSSTPSARIAAGGVTPLPRSERSMPPPRTKRRHINDRFSKGFHRFADDLGENKGEPNGRLRERESDSLEQENRRRGLPSPCRIPLDARRDPQGRRAPVRNVAVEVHRW